MSLRDEMALSRRDEMALMAHWAGVVSEEVFATERLYARDVIAVDVGDAAVRVGDQVALIVATEPHAVFGVGDVVGISETGQTLVEYRHRLPDEPPPLPPHLVPASATLGLHALTAVDYVRLAAMVSDVDARRTGRTEWFVSLALPIEAATQAEAVREFWTYVDKLGPRELPAYVWPRGDDLAMQAFVLGAIANLDPEEE